MLIQKYIQELEKIQQVYEKEHGNTRLIFRGHANKAWDIQSSAARRLKKSNKTGQAEFINYHEKLIADAKKSFFDSYVGISRQLEELELLAAIQHNGGATCFIDFSKSFLVALWFACKEHYEAELNEKKEHTGKMIKTDGKVLVLNLFSSTSYINFLNSDLHFPFERIMKFDTNIKNPHIKMRKRNAKALFWVWDPSSLNNRIVQQNSIFIFSPDAITKNDFKEIAICEGDKNSLLEELREYFNICPETIFSDLQGYSFEANNVERILVSDDFDQAMDFYFERKYSLSLDYFTTYINRHKKDNSNKMSISYFRRGICYQRMSRFKEAIEDYSKATTDNIYFYINSRLMIADIYYSQKKYDEAIKEYEEIITIKDNEKESQNSLKYYFNILELAIFSNDQIVFHNAKVKFKKLIGKDSQYIRLMLMYFSCLLKIRYNDPRKIKIIKIENFLKNNIENLLGKIKIDDEYYCWDFNDIYDWLEDLKNQYKDEKWIIKIKDLQVLTDTMSNFQLKVKSKILSMKSYSL